MDALDLNAGFDHCSSRELSRVSNLQWPSLGHCVHHPIATK